MKNLRKRKQKQLDVCLKGDVEMTASNGFEKYSFVHNALPEIDFAEIDTSTKFLGKKLSAPILISSMVGGTSSAARINRNLAVAAQRLGVAMGVGSQRIALEAKSEKQKAKSYNLKLKTEKIMKSFQVRDPAPDILLFANFGAIQLNYGFGVKEVKRAVETIKADGLILHLNPLQEVLQNNGQTNFKGLFDKITHVVNFVQTPIIIKEVGCGMSYETAKKLYNAGIRIIDTAGAGGTSWAEIEVQNSKLKAKSYSAKFKALRNPFKNWGIVTAESLIQCKKVKGMKAIASGGIRNGIEIAKAIALGADLVGIGLPLLKPAQEGEKEVERVLKQLIFELKTTMFCVGARNIKELRKTKIVTRY